MTETIEPMAAQIDQQRLAKALVDQARAEGVQLVGDVDHAQRAGSTWTCSQSGPAVRCQYRRPDPALVGVLVSVHVAAAEAGQVVLIFRLPTFWPYAVVGILATQQLRGQDAL